MSNSERITELEIKLTHAEHMLEELNGVIVQQAKELDAVKRALELLAQRSAGSDEAFGPADDKPPHY